MWLHFIKKTSQVTWLHKRPLLISLCFVGFQLKLMKSGVKNLNNNSYQLLLISQQLTAIHSPENDALTAIQCLKILLTDRYRLSWNLYFESYPVPWKLDKVTAIHSPESATLTAIHCLENWTKWQLSTLLKMVLWQLYSALKILTEWQLSSVLKKILNNVNHNRKQK